MVTRLSKRIALLLLLSAIASISHAASQLLMFTDKVETEIGRPIRVELIGVSLKLKLAAINLNAFNKDFAVITDYAIDDASDDRWPKQSIQILKLKLYPRKTGRLTLPALFIDNSQSKAITITALTGETAPPALTLSTHNPYIRQQFVVHISVTSNNLSARLSINEDDKIAGFESRPLAFTRTKLKDGSYRLQIGWALTTFKTGVQSLELPAVGYSVSGVSRKQYFFPATTIKVEPLPLYLPPTIPVGKVSIHSSFDQTSFLATILSTDSLHYWNLTLKGNMSNTYRLPPVLRQIKSNNKISFLAINSTRTVNASDDQLVSQVTHSIPFKALRSGLLSLPKIQLQYFDPASGKIKTVAHQPQRQLVLGSFWKSVIVIILASLLAWLIFIIYKKAQKIKYSRLMYQQAITLLNEQKNIQTFREAIRLIASAEYWVTNITLTQWCDMWSEKYKTGMDFKTLCKALSDSLYQSQSQHDVSKLTHQLIVLLENKARL